MTDSTPQPYFPQDLDNYAPWVAKYGLLAPYGECQCGCGEAVGLAFESQYKFGMIKGKPRRYIVGHGRRKQQPPLHPCQCGCGQMVKGKYAAYHGNSVRGLRYPAIEDAFWAHVKKGAPDECWEWQGTVHRAKGRGYGTLSYDHKIYRAHRLSWEIHNGPIPNGLFVCHTCDRRDCVNISHLWLGTHEDNQNDKIKKGRTAKGQDAARSKLIESDVAEMKRLFRQGIARKDIAAVFAVPYYTLCDILNGRTWKHVP